MSPIYAPDGRVASARPEEHWPPEFMKMLAVFAETLHTTKLGIRCEQCKQPLNGHNAREDNFWRMECGCRTYIGRNPLPASARQAH